MKKNNLKFILAEFLTTIWNISSTDYQERVWIKGEGPECDDFDETVDYFFFEGLEIIENYQLYGILKSQHQLLLKFRDEFRKFSDDNDYPEEFIATPEWIQITEMAKDVLEAFHFEKKISFQYAVSHEKILACSTHFCFLFC